MPPNTSEQKARKELDRQLEAAGWPVQNFKDMNIHAAPCRAVREFPLRTGFADYMLYADGKAIGLVEAKPEGHTLTDMEVQSSKYTFGLPQHLPVWHRPLPFAYESTGTSTQFTNALEPDFRSREVFTFHRPEELLRLAKLDVQLRGRLQTLPLLETERLWEPQPEAIRNLESSLFEAESPLNREPLPVVYNPQTPIETFGFIVIDECHRSIYNLWRHPRGIHPG